MSLGVVLDVAIGMALTYSFLGIIAAAVQESIAAALKLRGKQLQKGIANLLADGSPVTAADTLAQQVFGHSLVKGISTTGLPSYVPSRNFALALFDVLADGSQAPVFSQIESSIAELPACSCREAMKSLVVDAGGDLDKLQSSVRKWYEDAMDRLSGEYKRFSHWFALGFGLAVAVMFNVSSFQLATMLWTDPILRAQLVTEATHETQHAASATMDNDGIQLAAAGADADGTAGKSAGATPPSAEEATRLLTALPIGWSSVRKDGSDKRSVFRLFMDTVFAPDWSGVGLVFGWLTTGFAVSLGTPFWFDTMQKLVNLRGTGPKPARSDDEAGTS
jgi:hypothetical protein